MRSFDEGLRGLGHDVEVIAPIALDRSAPEDERGVRRVAVRPRELGAVGAATHSLRLVRALRRAAREAAPCDVVVTSTPPPMAALAALSVRAPLVLDVRDIWPDVLVEAGALNGRG